MKSPMVTETLKQGPAGCIYWTPARVGEGWEGQAGDEGPPFPLSQGRVDSDPRSLSCLSE